MLIGKNDGVDGPLVRAKLVFRRNQKVEGLRFSEPPMRAAMDLAKHVFQVHGIDAQATTVLRKRLRRGQVLAFFSRIPRSPARPASVIRTRTISIERPPATMSSACFASPKPISTASRLLYQIAFTSGTNNP
jgi:hypothetical protein